MVDSEKRIWQLGKRFAWLPAYLESEAEVIEARGIHFDCSSKEKLRTDRELALHVPHPPAEHPTWGATEVGVGKETRDPTTTTVLRHFDCEKLPIIGVELMPFIHGIGDLLDRVLVFWCRDHIGAGVEKRGNSRK